MANSPHPETVRMSSSAALPLITLQPVADAHEIWTALLLHADRAPAAGWLAALLDDAAFGALLASTACIVAADAATVGLAAERIPPRLHLLPADGEGGFAGFGRPVAFAVPSALPGGKGSDPVGRSLLLKLLALTAADADSDAIEALIKRDPNLSYQLLKLVNSVAYAPGKRIDNFAQAIAMLGRRQLQRWLQLLLYARSAGSVTASPLLPRAAWRASLMEGLARHAGMGREREDRAFMVGMFSLLDALFGTPIDAVVAPLNLADELFDALTTGGGPLGPLRGLMLASEGAPGEELATRLAAAGIAHADWARILAAACRWAVQVAGEA